MDNQRRGFLKWFGAAAATAPIAAAAHTVGVGRPETEATAFRFECFCAASVVAAVPKGQSWLSRRLHGEQKPVVTVNCERCGRPYVMTWHGDHFSFH